MHAAVRNRFPFRNDEPKLSVYISKRINTYQSHIHAQEYYAKAWAYIDDVKAKLNKKDELW